MNEGYFSLFVPRSAVPGVAWPAIPAPAGATMLAMQQQLGRTQWLSAAELMALQMQQLRLLVAHAVAQVPHYERHLRQTGLRSAGDLDAVSYLEWPVLGTHEPGTLGPSLKAKTYPREHGGAFEMFTSGATGTPKRIWNTEAAQFFAQALVLRDHLWHRRDLAGKFAAIRFFAKAGRYAAWSVVTHAVFDTGPAVELDVATDVAAQLDWLLEERPEYLLTSPSNLTALLARSEEAGRAPPGLRQVIAYSEPVSERLRRRVRALWAAPLVDSYSCTEAGALALQCPESGNYHVQSENVYVEILRHDGRPCAPGEAGRVVITPLHNFAMPLLRYDLGDIAVAGASCPCGRGLPVLASIAGRARNMARDPAGRLFQPGFDAALDEARLPVTQFQFVQQTTSIVEMSYVSERDLSAEEMQRFSDSVKRGLPYPFEMRFRRVERIERGAGGKYEGFISKVA